MSENKKKTVSIGQYLVAKNGTTKYIKLECSPKADQATKDLVERIKEAVGGDVLFVNLFDSEFRSKHNIPDFAKGRIEAPIPEGSTPSKSKKGSNEEVPF